MFDFNTKPLATGAIAGAAIIGGAQAVDAAIVVDLADSESTSQVDGVPAIYEHTFLAINSVNRVEVALDGGEGSTFAEIRSDTATVASIVEVQLELDGIWTTVFSDTLGPVSGGFGDGIFFNGSG